MKSLVYIATASRLNVGIASLVRFIGGSCIHASLLLGIEGERPRRTNKRLSRASIHQPKVLRPEGDPRETHQISLER